jgi:hypothetical protein
MLMFTVFEFVPGFHDSSISSLPIGPGRIAIVLPDRRAGRAKDLSLRDRHFTDS